ncbi:MAG TPA: MFS transporter [Thermoanaerobaculia bacterium]|nr:MFS transporter [Thermoanaerobaculia bacterium]
MRHDPLEFDWRRIQRVYLILLLLHTLAASLIWGINTLFLLDAGLSNAEAFAANAFFTAGLVLFEIPTGVIADVRGRRLSYLLGTVTLTVATLLYLWLWHIAAPFWAWGVTSAFLGFGFTFFSGAVQAWLVDALRARGYDGPLDAVFARGEIVEGVAMLGGAVAGGAIAQFTNLGVPYILRAAVLALSFVLAFVLMRDVGFTPQRTSVRHILSEAMKYGLRNPPVRWVMLANVFTDGVSIYAFYAMQPYLLQLYGDPKAYWIAGLAAAIVGGAQIVGGLLVPHLARMFRRRTTIILTAVVSSTLILTLIGLLPRFWVALALLVLWGLVFATVMPIRQAYVNDLIPSMQRATVLSFDSLMGSGGGVAAQPILGRAADLWGYPMSYVCSAAIQGLAIPFVWLARREGNGGSDLTPYPRPGPTPRRG